MSVWICGVCNENWKTVKDKQIWAVTNESKKQKIKANDFILFYVRGTDLFRGIFQVVGNWYKASRPEWPDENDCIKYPFQVKLKTIILGDVSFTRILAMLSFIKFKCFPTLHLTSTPCGALNFGEPISYRDLQLIAKLMKDNSENRIFNSSTINENQTPVSLVQTTVGSRIKRF